MDTSAPLVMQWHNALFHSSPHTSQMLPGIPHILHPSLVVSLLNYAPDMVNWTDVMAVRRPLIWRNDSMVVVFIQLLCIVSLQTLQTKIAAYDNHYRGLEDTRLSRYLVCGRRPFC